MPFLTGKAAIVTGAAIGLGTAYARALVQEGAAVAICDVRPEVEQVAAELRAAGGTVRCTVADVSNPADVRRIVDGAADEFGGLDLLISNAGTHRNRTILDSPLDEALADFDAVYGANFKGVFLFGRATMPHLIARGGGNIINVATDHHCTCGAPNVWNHDDAPDCRWGSDNPRPNGARTDIYDSSKSGVTGLTLAWAKALAPHKIRVNAFCMGATDTAMLRSIFNGPPPPEVVATWMRPEQIAAAMLELLKEGPEGRSGENIGFAVGHPVRLPRRQIEPIFSGTR